MATTEQETFEKRLFKVARELNISTDRVVEYLEEHDYEDALTGSGFNASIVDEEAYLVLRDEFADDAEAAARIRELRSGKEGDGASERDEVATLDEEQEAEPEISDEEESAEADAAAADGEASSTTDAEEPADASTMDWAGRSTFGAADKTPVAVLDYGAHGKESMCKLVAPDAGTLSERVLALLDAVEG